MRSWERGNFSCSSRPRPQACTRPPHHHSLVTTFIDHFLNTLLRCTEYLNVLVDVGGFLRLQIIYLIYLLTQPFELIGWCDCIKHFYFYCLRILLYGMASNSCNSYSYWGPEALSVFPANHSPIYPHTFTFTAMLRLWFLSLSPSQRIQTCRAVTRLGHDPIRVSELSY